MLYRTVFDAMCSVLFLKQFGIYNWIKQYHYLKNSAPGIKTINNICEDILKKWIFKDGDLFEDFRSSGLKMFKMDDFHVFTEIKVTPVTPPLEVQIHTRK